MEMQTYSKKQAAGALEIKPATIAHYSNYEFIIPEIDAKGRGAMRRYSTRNLVEIQLLRTFTSYGIALNSCRSLLEHLKNDQVLKALGFDPLDVNAPETQDREIYLFIYDDSEVAGMFFDIRWLMDPGTSIEVLTWNKLKGAPVKTIKCVYLTDILEKIRKV